MLLALHRVDGDDNRIEVYFSCSALMCPARSPGGAVTFRTHVET